MILTVEQADAKWCPHARAVFLPKDQAFDNRIEHPHNRVGGDPDYCRCVSSDCMAWRWHDPKTDNPGDECIRRGYCGLSGPVVHP